MTTGGPDTKFYSNGIDVNWLAHPAQTTEGKQYLANQFVPKLRQMLLRLLTFPMPTVAAINGVCAIPAAGDWFPLTQVVLMLDKEKI